MMPNPNQAVLDFLLTRRSRPHKTLTTPVPDKATIDTLLTAASRTPDHGKLEPWRFIVLEDAALTRLGALAHARGTALGHDPDACDKIRFMFSNAHLSIAVVASPVASPKIPEVEQTLSAGAACLALLNAALASGWGANWLSGWTAYDRQFLTEGLALKPQEFVAGFIHLGSETSTPPDRPRPNIAAKTTWVSE